MSLPIPLITAIITRLIDRKKPLGKTNVTTAAGVGAATTSYIFLVQSDDPVLQVCGITGLLLGIVISLYKETKSDD